MISEPKTQNDLQNDQKSIRFFTMNHMAFRRVEKPYKTCRKWRIMRSPECSTLGENNIVYGVLNEISQKVRISEFQNGWMGGGLFPSPVIGKPQGGTTGNARESLGELYVIEKEIIGIHPETS